MINCVFLGGTTCETDWRSTVQSNLQQSIKSFNPIVEDWTEDCIENEKHMKREICNIHLYVITSEMKGVYSIAEAVESVHMSNKTTILHIVPDGFSDGELRSLKATCDIIHSHGGIAYVDGDLNRSIRVINYSFGEF